MFDTLVYHNSNSLKTELVPFVRDFCAQVNIRVGGVQDITNVCVRLIVYCKNFTVSSECNYFFSILPNFRDNFD